MSSRVAHRPHYRNTHHLVQASLYTRNKFFHTRWVYRNQSVRYEKHPLGYSLSFIPLSYRFMHNIVARRA